MPRSRAEALRAIELLVRDPLQPRVKSSISAAWRRSESAYARAGAGRAALRPTQANPTRSDRSHARARRSPRGSHAAGNSVALLARKRAERLGPDGRESSVLPRISQTADAATGSSERGDTTVIDVVRSPSGARPRGVPLVMRPTRCASKQRCGVSGTDATRCKSTFRNSRDDGLCMDSECAGFVPRTNACGGLSPM